MKDAEAFKVVLETQMLESNKMRVGLEEAAAKQAYEINRLKERVHRHSEHIVDLQDEKTELKGKIETLEAQVHGVS